jgi:hypothetical protein
MAQQSKMAQPTSFFFSEFLPYHFLTDLTEQIHFRNNMLCTVCTTLLLARIFLNGAGIQDGDEKVFKLVENSFLFY